MDPNQIVRTGYDQMSRAYRADDAGPDTMARYAGFLGELMRLVPEGAAVLDLGCGCGVPGTAILARRFRVTGLDISAI